MDETTYEIECEVCEVVVEVTVYDTDEQPEYCPMCGTPI